MNSDDTSWQIRVSILENDNAALRKQRNDLLKELSRLEEADLVIENQQLRKQVAAMQYRLDKLSEVKDMAGELLGNAEYLNQLLGCL